MIVKPDGSMHWRKTTPPGCGGFFIVMGRSPCLVVIDIINVLRVTRQSGKSPAGIATLQILAATDACARANAFGDEVRKKMNAVLEEERIKWAVHGSYSGIHIYTNPEGADIVPNEFDAGAFIPTMLAKPRSDGVTGQVRMGLLVNGVDMNTGPSGYISAMHGEEEMAVTVDAFRATVRALKREGTI